MKNVDNESQKNHHLIIPIFIMNSGCPHRCIFCNQKITAGKFPLKITKDYFDAEIHSYLTWNKDKSRKVEIAFYGGSFTGVDPEYQEELLSWANAFMKRKLVHSLRISTRPDYISTDHLTLLKKQGVDTVEIGAQSFVDDVLQKAHRGHNAEDVEQAMTLLKENGFKTGLHLMVGLPQDTKEGFLYSIDKTIALQPDTARIHPVIVFKHTILADQFNKGEYKPLNLPDAVELCRLAWERLSLAGIRVIRTGLQTTPEMEKNGAVLAGPIHPAFGTLVLSSVFYHYIIKLLSDISPNTQELRCRVCHRDISTFRGFNNSNMKAIKKLYPLTNLIVESSKNQDRGKIYITTDSGTSHILKIPGLV